MPSSTGNPGKVQVPRETGPPPRVPDSEVESLNEKVCGAQPGSRKCDGEIASDGLYLTVHHLFNN